MTDEERKIWDNRVFEAEGNRPRTSVDEAVIAVNAELSQYKRLLHEEIVIAVALTKELNDIAAALGIFRHPDEREQLANCAEKMREENKRLREEIRDLKIKWNGSIDAQQHLFMENLELRRRAKEG
jgi:hypothetical protein